MTEIRPETPVQLRNLTKWNLYFRSITGKGYGRDVKLPPNSDQIRVPFEEVQAQIYLRNSLLVGTDGYGSHARIQIVDEDIRAELFDHNQPREVVLLTHSAVTDLLSIRNKAAFSKRLKELIVTFAEKAMLMELAKEAGLEHCEHWKVKAIEEICRDTPKFDSNKGGRYVR